MLSSDPIFWGSKQGNDEKFWAPHLHCWCQAWAFSWENLSIISFPFSLFLTKQALRGRLQWGTTEWCFIILVGTRILVYAVFAEATVVSYLHLKKLLCIFYFRYKFEITFSCVFISFTYFFVLLERMFLTRKHYIIDEW